MRRMYSVKELSEIIYSVVGGYIEAGAFDQIIEDDILAYIEDHPIDPTAITGLDIAPKDVTASGNITGASIIENMSGYSYTEPTKENVTLSVIYAGAVKNGNKLTLACAGTLEKTGDISGDNFTIAIFGIPSAVGSKLANVTQAGVNGLSFGQLYLAKNYSSGDTKPCLVRKDSNVQISTVLYNLGDLELNTAYLFRFEITFLLSDSLAE